MYFIADTDIYALLKPLLEDINWYFFLSICRQTTNKRTKYTNEKADYHCNKLGTHYK